jgi:tetratricopeptide (TPR) repeat protein
MVSTTANSKRGYTTWICLFLMLVILTGITFQTVLAESAGERQAKQQKADSYVRIAQEQVKRGYYQQAQALIAQIRENFTPYLTEAHARTLEDLSNQINLAMAERQKITASLKQADELSAQGQYQQALTLLQEIKASPYITKEERTIVQDSINEIQGKLQTENNSIQQIYDQAVKDYLAKDYEKAKAGFMKVVESGAAVTGSLTPMDYLKMIDQVQQASVPAESTPVESKLSVGEEIEVELMRMVPSEPAAEIHEPTPPRCAG